MGGVILSLGSINADFQLRVERPPGSAEMLPAHDLLRLGGGKAANVACLARLLGHEAWLFGRVGDDDLAEQALAPLRPAGIDIAGVSHVRGMQTGVAMIMVPPSGKKHIVLAGNANDEWSGDAVDAVCRRIDDAPPASVLAADCEIPADVVRRAASAAKRRGLAVVLDPSFAARADDALLATVDVLTPNEAEARDLSGGEAGNVLEAARALSARGPAIVCIKREGGGCLLLERGRHREIAAVEVEVVDTTGAGDAFTGAFAVALLEGRSAEQAAHFAVAASTLAITAYGSQPSYPRRDAVEALLRKQQDRTPR